MDRLARMLSQAAGGITPTYIEDVFSTYLYTNTTDSNRFPIKTDVGFISTDAWHSNVMLNSGSARGCVCAYDSSGNYYLAGGLTNSLFVLAKYNSQGSIIWIRDITSTGGLYLDTTIKNIKVTNAGDIYLVGNKGGTIFVIKLNSSGTVVWTREFTSVAFSSGYISMNIDSSENVHVMYTTSTFTLRYFVLNSSGTIDNSKSKSISIQEDASAQNFLGDMRLDSSGNVYVCGRLYLPSTAFYYAYVIKLNSSFQVQWYRSINKSVGVPNFKKLDVDAAGNVYVTGVLRGSVYEELYVEKLNSSGVSQWSKVIQVPAASVAGEGIKVDSEGNLYVTSVGLNYSWIIVKLNNSGASLWQKIVHSTTYSGYIQPYSLDIDSNNNLYVSGNTNETTVTNTHRYQIYKISQSGASFGITPYSSLTSRSAFGQYSIVNAVITGVGTHTFVVSSPTITSTTVTYTSATSTIVNQFISIPAKQNNGGLLWIKSRSAVGSHLLALTENSYLNTNTTGVQFSIAENDSGGVTSLSSNGFLVKSNNTTNTSVAWTFRKQPKFFDVVTWTGDGNASKTISHNLGSTPGVVIAKNYSSADSWYVYHRYLGATQFLVLNATDAATTFSTVWANTNPTSTQFTVGATLNSNGTTYVAYIFAHDAGGFGASGTDNVISCGSYTGNGSATGPVVTLGYESQWVMVKRADNTSNWHMYDAMRGFNVSTSQAKLYANTTDSESTDYHFSPLSTGFQVISSDINVNTNGGTYIYIAIRRGPMRTPATGTSVFAPIAYTGTGAAGQVTGANFPPDLLWANSRNVGSNFPNSVDKLRGNNAWLFRSATTAETTITNVITSFDQNGIGVGTTASGPVNSSGQQNIFWMFGRAPGFFDVVCYTGTGATQTINHNLGVAPELMIWKRRTGGTGSWIVGTQFGASNFLLLYLNDPAGENVPPYTYAGSGQLTAAPTSTSWGVTGISPAANVSGSTYVTYLFATVAGVSKVGSYTGNGSSQTINCGFTAGARFVLIKATSTTGDWYVWDSARGIISANDPHLSLNSTAAEVTTNDSIDPDNSGFIVNQVAATNINVTSATYIFLAIA